MFNKNFWWFQNKNATFKIWIFFDICSNRNGQFSVSKYKVYGQTRYIFGIPGQFWTKSASVYFIFFYSKNSWVGPLLLFKFLWICRNDSSAASSRCNRFILLQVAAACCKKSCKWLILLQVADASCKKKLQVVDIAASGRCRGLLQVACCNW